MRHYKIVQRDWKDEQRKPFACCSALFNPLISFVSLQEPANSGLRRRTPFPVIVFTDNVRQEHRVVFLYLFQSFSPCRIHSTSRMFCPNCIRPECIVRSTVYRRYSVAALHLCKSARHPEWSAGSTTFLRFEDPAEGFRHTKRRTVTAMLR